MSNTVSPESAAAVTGVPRNPDRRYRSAGQLMRGMTAALLLGFVLEVAVGAWMLGQFNASGDALVQVDEAALIAAQVRTSLAMTGMAQTIAGVDESVIAQLPGAVQRAGLDKISQDNALVAATYTRSAIEGDGSHRAQASSALVDLEGALRLRRHEVVGVVQQQAHLMAVIALTTLVLAALVVAGTALWVRNSLFARFRDMSQTAVRIVAGSPELLDTRVRDPLGAVAVSFNAGIKLQRDLVRRLEHEAQRGVISRQIVDALEMVTSREDVYDVVRVATTSIHGPVGIELLMKSPDGSSLVREVESPDGPLCPVQHGGDCIALRRGTVQRFPDTDAINACGHLRRRETPPAGAVCIPATFLGEALGVLHVVADGRDDPRADDGLLVELSSLMAGRLGTLRAFDQESQNARTDPLTGLGNRRDFEARAAKVGSGVLAMGDLDFFKLINDQHGHEVGDQSLRTFADALRSTTRADVDIVARWGGEEFAVLLPNASMSEAIDIVTRVRDTLRAATLRMPPAFTSSWGLALVTDGPLTSVIQRADRALYEAKERGRNCWVIAQSDTAALDPASMSTEADVR